jgi:hypothetical protein
MKEASAMVEQDGMVLERDVSELVSHVWIAYWRRLGWEVQGRPTVVGRHASGARVLDVHLRAAHPGAVVPRVHSAYDLRALAA